jgi:hypothetical protein
LGIGKRAALSLALASLTACVPGSTSTQGKDKVGDFTFLANATADTCLSSQLPSSLTFSASLSRTNNVLYFNGPGGTVQGSIVGQNFTVTFSGTSMVDALCSVTRDENLTATLSGSTLSGTYLIRMIPVQGANCIAAVAGANRQFATLPCSVQYNLVGERTDTPDGGTDGGAGDGGAAADGGASDGGS